SILICFPLTSDTRSIPASLNSVAISLINPAGLLVVNKSTSAGILDFPIICVLCATEPPTTRLSLFLIITLSNALAAVDDNLSASAKLILLGFVLTPFNSSTDSSNLSSFC
ncbi:hypothetical protein LCGC14_2397760, partial [marine sediment metagenome]